MFCSSVISLKRKKENACDFIVVGFLLKVYHKIRPVIVKYKTKEQIGTASFKSWLFVKVPLKL